jgi:LuxR family maltose regulon positive regulatory protein
MLPCMKDSMKQEILTTSSAEGREDEPLIVTKLTIPPMCPNIVSRPRLLARLDEGMKRKVTLLASMAGSGKTILLSEWASHCSQPVAWVSLDENDNDLILFWRYIVASMEPVQLDVCQLLCGWLQSLQTNTPASAFTLLINTIAALPLDFVLVLDNYGSIRHQAIHQSLTFLLEHLPSNMHIFIASREVPPLPLSRLRAHGHLTEILEADLRFTCDEATAFFTRVMRVSLPEETIARLVSRTEGWIIGLQLDALSLQMRQDGVDPGENFTGNNSHIFDYLAHEVFQRQPEEVQTFLLETSLLDRFCGSLCNALTDRADSSQMLEWLERTGLFIVPLDRQNQWHRYHHLFRDFLRKLLLERQADSVRQLHRRAYLWYEQNHLLAEAITHALAAKDFLKAACLIMRVGKTMMERNEVATLYRWVEALPEGLVRSLPQLSAFRTWFLLVDGASSTIQSWLHYVQQRLALPLPELPPAPPVSFESERRGNRAQAAEIVLLAYVTIFQGNAPCTAEWAHRALAALPGDNLFLQGLGLLNAGFASWFEGDSATATRTLLKARRAGQAGKNASIVLIALNGLAHIQMFQGQLHRALKTTQRIGEFVEEQGCQALWMAACAHMCRGYLFYAWNELNTSAQCLQEGIALAEKFEHHGMLMYGLTILALVMQAKGEQERAIQLVQQANRYLPGRQHYTWITAMVLALQTRLALIQKNGETVDEWEPACMSNFLVSTFEQLTLARMHLASRRLNEALKILDEYIHEAELKGHTSFLIEVLLLRALVYGQLNLPQALTTLIHALELAEPEGNMRLFLDEGQPVMELLTEALRQMPAKAGGSSHALAGYIRKLLQAFGKSSQEVEKMVQLSFHEKDSRADALSKRETEIVRLMASGLSNQEIAQKLVLAESTVKWYIKSIYSKLGVHNRVQVTLRANALSRIDLAPAL